MENFVQFPIFGFEPTKAKEIERYDRKIMGITNTNVLSLIKDTQPYQVGTDVEDHALLIVHNMDRFDKHRELVIVGSSIDVVFPPTDTEMWAKAKLYAQSKHPDREPSLGRAFKDYKATPGIAFKEFGSFRPYSVFVGLAQLLGAVDNAVDAFASEV